MARDGFLGSSTASQDAPVNFRPGTRSPPQGVGFPDLSNHFKQYRPAGIAKAFQRWRYRKADSLLRPALIRYHKVGS